MKKKQIKRVNPVAKNLKLNKPVVIESKLRYTRKTKHKEGLDINEWCDTS